jgi:hypothetical protein
MPTSRKHRQKKPAAPAAAEPAEGRDERGRFQPGNDCGFKPGQSGNPAGRPKCRTLSEAYRVKLARVDESDPEGRTFAEKIADAQVTLAASSDMGSTFAAKELGDRTEGRPRQAVEVVDGNWKEKEAQYERLIDHISKMWEAKQGAAPARNDVIARIAVQKPEILTFFPLPASDQGH